MPALLAYDGIQYTYMAPAVFEDGQYDYVQEHLRILSGFYGMVKPMDGVVPYRLEMQAKAAVGGHKNLYDFRGDILYREVIGDSRTVINLIQNALRNICSRVTGILPASLVNWKVIKSSRRVSTPRWPEAKWFATWQGFMQRLRSR